MARLRSRHRGQVHRDGADTHAVFRAAARLVRQARAGNHRLSRRAPPVDADAAELITLDQRYLLARLRQLARRNRPPWLVPITTAS
jgi:hypothetical protein